MASTQDHLPLEDIKDDVVILKDGSMALVLQTSAVNFGLLSDMEQLAIISSFASLLNSLSFAIQIVIRSKRLDVTSYLEKLAIAQKAQTNQLLSKMMGNYRVFIEQTVRENEVLDKQFYIIIPVSYLELGIKKDIKGHFNKALTILIPRRDHIIRQLWRVGLKASQIKSKQLIKLFYDIYNPSDGSLSSPLVENLVSQTPQPVIQVPPSQIVPKEKILQATQTPIQQQVVISANNPKPTPVTSPPRTVPFGAPFVVEELNDEYGTS